MFGAQFNLYFPEAFNCFLMILVTIRQRIDSVSIIQQSYSLINCHMKYINLKSRTGDSIKRHSSNEMINMNLFIDITKR